MNSHNNIETNIQFENHSIRFPGDLSTQNVITVIGSIEGPVHSERIFITWTIGDAECFLDSFDERSEWNGRSFTCTLAGESSIRLLDCKNEEFIGVEMSGSGNSIFTMFELPALFDSLEAAIKTARG